MCSVDTYVNCHACLTIPLDPHFNAAPDETASSGKSHIIKQLKGTVLIKCMFYEKYYVKVNASMTSCWHCTFPITILPDAAVPGDREPSISILYKKYEGKNGLYKFAVGWKWHVFFNCYVYVHAPITSNRGASVSPGPCLSNDTILSPWPMTHRPSWGGGCFYLATHSDALPIRRRGIQIVSFY